MSLTDATPEVRADVLAALAEILIRGVVVEPIGYSMGAGVRIRLADEPAPSTEAEGTGPAVASW